MTPEEIQDLANPQRFVEILDLDDPVETRLPDYTPPTNEDGTEGDTPTWREYFCCRMNHRPTPSGERLFIGAGVFANRSVSITADELASLTDQGVELHPVSVIVTEEAIN